jgi:hypothetical protein
MEQCEHSNGIGPAYCDDATCTTVVHTISPGLMLLVADLCAPTSATPDPEPDLRESAAVVPGANMPVSFANYDPATSSWRTWQLCLDGEWERFSEPFPRSGTMRNGQCFPRAPWVRHIHGSECSLWPTPTKSLASGGGCAKEAERALKGVTRPSGHRITLRLTDLVKLRDGGLINPQWVEWLMGFPVDWTAWDTSETL